MIIDASNKAPIEQATIRLLNNMLHSAIFKGGAKASDMRMPHGRSIHGAAWESCPMYG